MGHYHSYEAEAKGLGTSVLDFTEEELRVNIKKPPHPQTNTGNISLRGNNDDTANRHLHDYSLAFSEVYTKKDPNINRTINSIRTNLHDQKLEEPHHPIAKVVKNEARDINQAIQFAEDIHYLRLEANNTANVNNNPMLVFNIPPIHEQLFLERQKGPGMTFSDRYSRFLGEFEMTLDTFEHAQKRIKFHEISENPKFKGDVRLPSSRFAEEKNFSASKNKSDSRLEMSQRDHPLNASMFSDKKPKNQLSSENSYDKPLNQSQMQNSSPYSRDQTKYHTFKADNNNYDVDIHMHSPQKNEESQLSNQKYLNESPQNPFYDHNNTSYSKKSLERVEGRLQITPRSSANKKVQVGGGSLNQSQSQSQIRQSQTKTPPMTNQKALSQSKKLESSGSKKAVATTPQKHIPIIPSTSKSEIQNMHFQTPDSRTKTPPSRRSSPSPNAAQVNLKKTDKRSVSPHQKGSGQKDSRIQYKAFWREAERPKVVKKNTKRVPLKHESAKIKEGFETLAKTMKPSKVLGVNEKYVPLEKKKSPEQLFDKSHEYELVYVRPSVQKNQSLESNNEQPQSQRNSEKKIQKGTSAADKNQDSTKKKKQPQKNNNYDEEQEYEEGEEEREEEQYNDEYQDQDREEEEEEDFDEGYDQGDRSLAEDEYMTERYERAQRRKNGDYSNYDNKPEYVETSIDISSYLNNQKMMPKFNQQANPQREDMYYGDNGDNGGDMYYDDNQQQPEYYEREYELPSSQNDYGDQRQQMRYAPKIRNKYNQERYEENPDFDDQNYLHDILDRVRNLHDKMENSFSDITRDHSRIAEEDEDRTEEQRYSQYKKDGGNRYRNQQDGRDPFYPARQDRYEQSEQVQNFPGSSKLKVFSKKLRSQGGR